MSANATTEISARSRPPVVDYAVYALIARCVFSLLSALALYGARGEVTRSVADANKSKNWSAATLHHNVDTLLRGNLISTLVMVALVAILSKFIRDGRNWSRWVYLVFSVLITRDLFQVLGFFQYHNVPVRLSTGLVGVSSIAAIVLMFLPESNAYFRPASGAPASLLGGLFRPRPNVRGGLPGGPTSGAPEPAGPVADGTAVGEPPAEQPPVTGNRQPPRGKSRQTGRPRRPGGAR
ncbi:MAG TPA: proline-rich domain-containing protein [Jatrophihabitans sp.]|nr:proline-rich domain-containing protein [Jatrophihabitans sp.]